MKDYSEVSYLQTVDGNGELTVLKAERRVVIAFGQIHDYTAWKYKTIDGRSVRASTIDDTFTIYPGNHRLFPKANCVEQSSLSR